MNRLIFTLLIFLIPAFSQVYAQKKDKMDKLPSETRTGDKYFNNKEYFLAAEQYNKALKSSPKHIYTHWKLAEAYRAYFDYNKAERAYSKVLSLGPEAYPLARFWYAAMQKTNGKYEEARVSFSAFLSGFEPASEEEKKFAEKARMEIKGCELALKELKKPVRDHQFSLIQQPINSSYSDYAPVIWENDSSLIITSARPGTKGSEVDSRMGGMYSDLFRYAKQADGNWQLVKLDDDFKLVNTLRNDGAGVFTADKMKFYYTSCFEGGNCAIYYTELKNGKWQKPVRLNENVNYPGTDTKQPALNTRGDTLFFVSDRPDGYGLNDIWYSVAIGPDDWSPAINMGDKINTPFMDMAPSYFHKEKVLFFSSNGHEGFGGLDLFMASDKNFETVRNLGLPFNSNRDDFYITLGEELGYMSSNRDNGAGNDDIYSFKIESNEQFIASISKDSLNDYNSISISGKILKDDGKQPAADITVPLKDENNITLKTATTNDEGFFRFENLPPDKNYKISVDDNEFQLTTNNDLVVDGLQIKGSEKEVSRKLFENIYFDFDMYSLRPEAKKVLDDLITFASKHPDIQIEMNANTDSIGSSFYNKQLSGKRGNAARDYLIANGLDKSNLVVNALGLEKPLVSNQNPIGRQLNRRVEFYILGGPGYVANAMVYIVEPQSTLESVAKKFKMTKEEIRKLNDLTTEKLSPFTPLRVYRTENDNVIASVSLKATEHAMPGILEARSAKKTEYGYGMGAASDAAEIKETGQSEDEYYVVQPDNTLFSIAKDFGLTVKELMELNNIKDASSILVGQKLKVSR
jgi:peptidoglycan-associated lipoprotein